jgi:hypothetical protein
MGFQINETDPPQGGHPLGNSAGVQHPVATGDNGLGAPVGAVGRPKLVLTWSRLSRVAWDWYCSFLEDGALSATLTQLNVFDAHAPGGAGWRECSSAIMYRPTCKGNTAGGALTDVEIIFTELVFAE